MRAIRLAGLIVLGTSLAMGGHPNLTIASTETVRHHMRAADVWRACRTRHVVACTDYVGSSFVCRCETSGARWRLVARIDLRLAVHLSKPRFAAHERMHIDDVRASLETFFAPFLDQTFAAREECESTAAALSRPALASDVIHDLLAASNEKFGCTKRERKP